MAPRSLIALLSQFTGLGGALPDELTVEAVGRLALRCGDGVGVADAAAEVTLRPSDFGLA